MKAASAAFILRGIAGAAAYDAAMTDPSLPTVRRLLDAARARIDPDDAGLLLGHVLGRSRGWLYAHAGDTVAGAQAEAFRALQARREQGEPVAYLCGRRGFWTLDLTVTPDTLIPRPETELLVELALERLCGGDTSVADLGTGSGAIALALASERPRARVIATDASAAALEVARANAHRLGLRNVDFRLGDWFGALEGERFELVASNPPYIEAGDPHLRRGDLRHEPQAALASGPDGLDAIRAIAAAAPAHLATGGWLLLEHGWTQGAAVRALLEAAGLVEVATHADLEQRDRVTLGRLTA